MPSVIIRPAKHYHYTTSTSASANIPNAYDNNTSTYATIRINAQIVFYGFDTSVLPQNVRIKNIRVFVEVRGKSDDLAIRAVHSATAGNKYTDCGDGYVNCPPSDSMYDPVIRTLSFEKAALYWNDNIDAFRAGGFQVNLDAKQFQPSYSYVYEVYAEIEYVTTINVTVNASPAEGGTVTGGGTYESGSTVTATATPNDGYVFSHWLVNGANAGNSNPISGALTADTTVTAVFEKSGVNNIFIGTAQPKEIYIGTQKVKGIYVGTTAVYET